MTFKKIFTILKYKIYKVHFFLLKTSKIPLLKNYLTLLFFRSFPYEAMLINNNTPIAIQKGCLSNFILDEDRLMEYIKTDSATFISCLLNNLKNKFSNIIILTNDLIQRLSIFLPHTLPIYSIDDLFHKNLNFFLLSVILKEHNGISLSQDDLYLISTLYTKYEKKDFNDIVIKIKNNFSKDKNCNEDLVERDENIKNDITKISFCSREHIPIFNILEDIIKNNNKLTKNPLELKKLLKWCNTVMFLYTKNIKLLENIIGCYKNSGKGFILSSAINFYLNQIELSAPFLQIKNHDKSFTIINRNKALVGNKKAFLKLTWEIILIFFSFLMLAYHYDKNTFETTEYYDINTFFTFYLINFAYVLYDAAIKNLNRVNSDCRNISQFYTTKKRFYISFIHLVTFISLTSSAVLVFFYSPCLIKISIALYIYSFLFYLLCLLEVLLNENGFFVLFKILKQSLNVLLNSSYFIHILIHMQSNFLCLFTTLCYDSEYLYFGYMTLLSILKCIQLFYKIIQGKYNHIFILKLIKIIFVFIVFFVEHKITDKTNIKRIFIAIAYEAMGFIWEIFMEINITRKNKAFYTIYYIMIVILSLFCRTTKIIIVFFPMYKNLYFMVKVMDTFHKMYFWTIFYDENKYIDNIEKINNKKTFDI